MKMNTLDWVAFVLLVVGGVNWGLISVNPSWDVVNLLLGSWPMVVRVVYGLVGLSALYSLYHAFIMK